MAEEKKDKKPERMTNAKFSKSKDFIETCKDVCTPTTRQASKYRNKKGIVYKTMRGGKK